MRQSCYMHSADSVCTVNCESVFGKFTILDGDQHALRKNKYSIARLNL